MNGIVLAVAVLALSSGAEPTVGPPHHALGQAGMKVSQIDGVIMATIIPDQPVPSMASAFPNSDRGVGVAGVSFADWFQPPAVRWNT